MLSRTSAVFACHDSLFEFDADHGVGAYACDEVDCAGAEVGPSRPLGLQYEFIELCGGSGVVTQEVVKLGVICGPVIDISLSPQYDLTESSFRR